MFYDEDGKGYMICSSANGRGHLYIAPMDEEKAYCDFDADNIKELIGSTGSYFDEDGTIKQKDKGGNGILVNVTVTPAKVSEAQSTVRSKNSLVTYWYSLESMRPVIIN